MDLFHYKYVIGWVSINMLVEFVTYMAKYIAINLDILIYYNKKYAKI